MGASEKRFGEIIDRYFPGRVFPQQEVPIPDWSKPHNYSTDFCMAIKEVNLWIDIEVDEPYDYKTGTPTHCWDDGRDANRNTFSCKTDGLSFDSVKSKLSIILKVAARKLP